MNMEAEHKHSHLQSGSSDEESITNVSDFQSPNEDGSLGRISNNNRRRRHKNKRRKKISEENQTRDEVPTLAQRGRDQGVARETRHNATVQKTGNKRSDYVALDCEMVGVGPLGVESAIARVTLVNWDNQTIFDTFVKVEKHVTDYRTFVSGVTRSDLESGSAMPLEQCRSLVKRLLKGKVLVGHGLQNDLIALGVSHPWSDVRDTAAYIPFMKTRTVGEEKKSVFFPRKLRDLAWERLGMKIQTEGKPHSPVEDAVAALFLYKSARAEWEALMNFKVPTTKPKVAVEEKKRALSPTTIITDVNNFGRDSNYHRQHSHHHNNHHHNHHRHHHQQQLQKGDVPRNLRMHRRPLPTSAQAPHQYRQHHSVPVRIDAVA